MTQASEFPYVTKMEARFGALEVIDVQRLADDCTDSWYNETLCEVNASVVRVGVLHGEYHWHHHNEEDEFFYVVEGQLLVDLEDRTVELNPRQGFVVPRGIEHRTRAPRRSIVLMVENSSIIPTGS